MIPEYSPAIAGPFAFVVISYFFLHTGGIFDSSTSPTKYDLMTQDSTFLAENLSRNEWIILKKQYILILVDFETDFSGTVPSFIQAIKESILGEGWGLNLFYRRIWSGKY